MMRIFSINSTSDLLQLYEISELTDEEVVAYGEAVTAFGDENAENLTPEEREIVLQNAKFVKSEAEVRACNRKLAALNVQPTASTAAVAPAKSRTSPFLEIVTWVFVALACVALLAEFAGIFFELPVPVLPAIGACMLLSIIAWALSGKL